MVAAAAAVLLSVAYCNALDGAFVFDDEPSIVTNESIRSLWPLSRVLWTQGAIGRTHDGRPLVNLSFAISYAVHGLWRPGLRIGNLLVHLVNVCLVFEIARRLLTLSQDSSVDEDTAAVVRHSRWLAAAIAILWAVHPLHTHVISYIVQRAESLGACFILGASLAAMTALDRGSFRAAGGAVILGVLGGLTKETTASILAVVAAFDWAYHDRFSAAVPTDTRRRVRSLLYAGLALNPLVIVGVAAATGGRGPSAGFGSAPVWDYFLTQCRAVWMYAGKTLWPRTLVLDHGDRLDTLATAWPWLVATLAAGIAIGVGWWRSPKAIFPLLAAMLLLAPSSSIVPIATQTIAEHRAYLASAAVIGFALATTHLLCARVARVGWLVASSGGGSSSALLGMLVAFSAAACIGRTIVRNRDFGTAATLWTRNVKDSPNNPRGLRNLAELFTLDQRYEIAERIYREALAHPQLAAHAACGLGDALRRQGRYAEARDSYVRALDKAEPPSDAQFMAIAGLAAAEVGLDNPALAIALVDELTGPRWQAVRVEPDERSKTIGKATVYKAAALRRFGRDPAAAETLADAVTFATVRPAAAESIARACDDMREFAAAARIWEPLAANDPSLLANLGVSRAEAGQIEGAVDAFRRAVEVYPDDPRMRRNLARALEMSATTRGTSAPTNIEPPP